jgi:hypothetical protein
MRYYEIFALTAIILFILNEAINKILNFSSEALANYGDFMGGTVGTLLTGASLILILITYKSQSKYQRTEAQKQTLQFGSQLIVDIETDIEQLTLNKSKGKKALFDLRVTSFPDGKYTFLDKLNSILNMYNQLFKMMEGIDDKDKKEFILTRTYFSFYSSILWPLYNKNIKKNILYTDIRDYLKEHHRDSDKLFKLYEDLTKRCVEYLYKEKNFIAKPKIVFLKGYDK